MFIRLLSDGLYGTDRKPRTLQSWFHLETLENLFLLKLFTGKRSKMISLKFISSSYVHFTGFYLNS